MTARARISAAGLLALCGRDAGDDAGDDGAGAPTHTTARHSSISTALGCLERAETDPGAAGTRTVRRCLSIRPAPGTASVLRFGPVDGSGPPNTHPRAHEHFSLCVQLADRHGAALDTPGRMLGRAVMDASNAAGAALLGARTNTTAPGAVLCFDWLRSSRAGDLGLSVRLSLRARVPVLGGNPPPAPGPVRPRWRHWRTVPVEVRVLHARITIDAEQGAAELVGSAAGQPQSCATALGRLQCAHTSPATGQTAPRLWDDSGALPMSPWLYTVLSCADELGAVGVRMHAGASDTVQLYFRPGLDALLSGIGAPGSVRTGSVAACAGMLVGGMLPPSAAHCWAMRVLGLDAPPSRLTARALRRAYRTASLVWHTDRWAGQARALREAAQEQFLVVAAAHQVLVEGMEDEDEEGGAEGDAVYL